MTARWSRSYRSDGLIEPIGLAMSATHFGPFYHPRQIAELKKALGITLDSTEGLLHEIQFGKKCGVRQIAEYRKRGLIAPVGFAMSSSAVSAFYHPRQIGELKKALGITLDNTDGLLSETQFGKASGLSRVAKYCKEGLIAPVGGLQCPAPGFALSTLAARR